LSRFTKERTERRISSDSEWYGENVTYEELAAGVKEYKRPDLLDDLYKKVNHELSPVIAQKLKARKMQFNSLGFGMFCFDRAAMTMYRNEEFYNPSKKNTVDARDIKPKSNGFVTKDGDKVIKRWEQKPDGSPKIRTNTKELFAYFPEVPRDRHAVEFFISPEAAASVSASAMLYCGISAVIMAELLIKAGIKVKINLVVGSAPARNRKHYTGCVIPVKQYDETLDRNVIALLTSDPRFMRWDVFKGLIVAFDKFNQEVPSGLGYAMDAKQLKALLEGSGYTKKSQAAHRYYFGGTFSEEEALADINSTIEDIAKMLKK
ncbi:MAG: DUF7192 family protein, partial [Bacteroidia bacterium]